MASRKHIVYAWATYFVAFCGASEFYFNVRTGNVIKSRLLRIYSRLVCLYFFCHFSVVQISAWHNMGTWPTQSKLMTVLMTGRPVAMWLSLVSSIACIHMRHQRIFELIKDLLRIDEFIDVSRYSGNQLKNPHLVRMYWMKILIVIQQTILLLLWMLTSDGELILLITIQGVIGILRGIYFLLYNIIWKICYSFVELQIYLKQLFVDPMAMTRKEQKVLEAHRKYYKLIHMTKDVCEIFKYPLYCYLLNMICNSCINGYSFCRLMFGNPLNNNSPINEWVTLFLNIINLFELYSLASIGDTAGRIHDEILLILRNSQIYSLSDLLIRSNDWLALQLTWQHTRMNIFGAVNIDLNLFFLVLATILLHIIYIMQSDYKYL